MTRREARDEAQSASAGASTANNSRRPPAHPVRGDLAFLSATRRLSHPAAGGSGLYAEAPPIVQNVLGTAGTPLDARTLDVMQRRLGADLSRVRIHTGEQAAASARAVHAHAYTVGTAIVFDNGRYAPHDAPGRRLLAHELVHTLQQGSRPTTSGERLGIERPDGASEHQAREIATLSASHQASREPGVRGGTAPLVTAANGVMQRQPSQAQELAAMPRTDLTIQVTTGTTEELVAERTRLAAILTAEAATLTSPDAAQLSRSLSRIEVLIKERGNSTLADAGMELLFDGSALRVRGGETANFSAVSGRPGPGGKFDYSAERQHLEDVGPIPEGPYWLNPRELKELSILGLVPAYAEAWGSHRITIHPFDTTQTFGRGGFFIHGGTVPGSAGCIDLTTSMASFATMIAAVPPGQKVKLRVSYPQLGDHPMPPSDRRAS